MFDHLPITFSAHAELVSQFSNAQRFIKQLEAWLNFATLKANWFGDESTLLNCVFLLLPSAHFQQTLKKVQHLPAAEQTAWHINNEHNYLVKQADNSKKVTIVLTRPDEDFANAATDHRLLEHQLKEQLTDIVNTIAKHNQLDAI